MLLKISLLSGEQIICTIIVRFSTFKNILQKNVTKNKLKHYCNNLLERNNFTIYHSKLHVYHSKIKKVCSDVKKYYKSIFITFFNFSFCHLRIIFKKVKMCTENAKKHFFFLIFYKINALHSLKITKKLTCFPSDRRWPNATETAEPAVWSRDGGALRCCYYCCCYAYAPCWHCCPWESLARFYPPERWATVAFSSGFVGRSAVDVSFARSRLSLRKTGLFYTCGLKAWNPQTLLYVARTSYLYKRHRTLSVHELRSRSMTRNS